MDGFRLLRERRSLMTKLVIGFAALLLSILLLGINAILAARDMSRQAAELYQRELLGISRIAGANIDLIATGRALRQMVLAPTFVDRDEARARLERAMLNLDQKMVVTRQNPSGDREKLLLNEFELELENYKRSIDDAIALIDRGNDYQRKATAYVSGEKFNQVADSVDGLLRRMVAVKEERARETTAAMARHGNDMQRLMLGLLVGGLLFGATVAVMIGRSLAQLADRLRSAIDDAARRNVDTHAEFDRAETRGMLESMADRASVEEGQAPNISPERARESVEPVDGSGVAPARRASILVVEDDASNHDVTGGLLANTDCEVTVADSGQQALELLKENPYDVVLMNMQMPMLDGISATLEIRKNPAFDRLPIIAITPRGLHQDKERCLAAGMDGHIAKPIDPGELYCALMRWIAPVGQ